MKQLLWTAKVPFLKAPEPGQLGNESLVALDTPVTCGWCGRWGGTDEGGTNVKSIAKMGAMAAIGATMSGVVLHRTGTFSPAEDREGDVRRRTIGAGMAGTGILAGAALAAIGARSGRAGAAQAGLGLAGAGAASGAVVGVAAGVAAIKRGADPHAADLNVKDTGRQWVRRYDTNASKSVDYPAETRQIAVAILNLQADLSKPPAVEARRPNDGSKPYDYKTTAWEFSELIRTFDSNADGWIQPAEGPDLISVLTNLTAPAPSTPSSPAAT